MLSVRAPDKAQVNCKLGHGLRIAAFLCRILVHRSGRRSRWSKIDRLRAFCSFTVGDSFHLAHLEPVQGRFGARGVIPERVIALQELYDLLAHLLAVVATVRGVRLLRMLAARLLLHRR